MPAGAINKKERCWRSKKGKYLFNHTALAKVFRAKMLEGIRQAGLGIPHCAPSKWVVDCKIIPTLYQPKPRPVLSCTCCGGAMVIVQTRIKASRRQKPDQAAEHATVIGGETVM